MKCHEIMLTEQVNAEFELPTLRKIKEKEQDHSFYRHESRCVKLHLTNKRTNGNNRFSLSSAWF